MLVEADPGDSKSPRLFDGRIEFGEIHHRQVDDLIDNLAELVVYKGGQVALVRADRMPTATRAVTIYPLLGSTGPAGPSNEDAHRS